MLALGEREPALRRLFPGSAVTHAQAIYAVREEMAQRMSDVVLRRTDLGTDGHPGAAALDEMQALLQRELNWPEARVRLERELLEKHFERYLALEPQGKRRLSA